MEQKNNFSPEQREEIMDAISDLCICTGLYVGDDTIEEFLINKISHLAATIFNEEELNTLMAVMDSHTDETERRFLEFVDKKNGVEKDGRDL